MPIAIVLIGLGIWMGIEVNRWAPVIIFLIAIIMIVAHFMVGPMTLIQKYVEEGDMDGAQALLAKVKNPKTLYKPVRSSYYMLKANISTMSDDLDGAEADLKKGFRSRYA